MKTPATLFLAFALLVTAIAPPGASLREAQAAAGLLPRAQSPALSSAVPSAPTVDIRVNAGGPDYTDLHGELWLADKVYAAGTWGYTAGTPFSRIMEIYGTGDDTLYQSQRSSPGQYLFDTGNGVFEVELRFAEIYATSDMRNFAVKIEGVEFLTAFNPYRFAGYQTALNTTFLVKVTDNQIKIEFTGTQPIINALRVTGGPTGTGRNEVRLNAAGFDYRDAQQNLWIADQAYMQDTRGYLGAESGASRSGVTIGGTSEQILFRTNRYGMTGYAFNLDSGQYRVDILFAELYPSITRSGTRVFDVWAEGVKVLPDVDVFRLAGNKYIAITQTFTANVLDQQLNITFTKKTAEPPIVNAIAVLPLDSTPPGPWTNFTPTGWQTTLTPPASIQVLDTQSGLNVATAQYAYSTNGGATFSAWQPASVTGSNGTTTTQLLTVGVVPFNQDSATQNRVKFRINDTNGNQGVSDAFTVQIDSTPPSSVITSPASGVVISGPTVTIQGTATDTASGVQSVEVSTDGGGSWQPATGTSAWSYPWAVPGDGVYNLRSRARDGIGFIETPGAGVTVTVDSVPPVTFIRTPTNGQAITNTTYLITGTAYDATSGIQRVELSFNGGANWVSATGTTLWSYGWTPLGQGPYTIRARSVDQAGHVDTPGTIVSVVVDQVAPRSTIVDPTPGRIIRGTSYAISGTASDAPPGSGLRLVEVSTDGLTWSAASGLTTWTYGWTLPGDGTYTVRSQAQDQAGNVQSPPASVTVIVDRTPPVSIASLNGTLGTDGWYISPVTLSLLASDATSGVRDIFYRIDAGEWITYSAAAQISLQGSRTIAYYAVDHAGNSESVRTLSLRIDSAAPAVFRFLSGTTGGSGWYRSAVLFNLVTTDIISGLRNAYYSLDGGPWTVFSGAFSVAAEGTHSISYYATDNAGNSSTVESVSFRIDTLAPVSTITWPVAGQVISGTGVVIQGTANDSGGSGISGVEVSINGGVWVPALGGASWSYVWAPPGPGQHNIRARATDVAHNAETSGSGIYISVDTTRPSSNIVSPYNGQIVQGPTAVVAGTAADTYSSVALVEVSTNGGGAWSPATLGSGGAWSFTWTITNDGIYNLRSRATDQAGNVEIAGAGISVQVDSIAPLSLIAAPVAGEYIRASAYLISGTASDIGSGVKRIEVSIDGGNWHLAAGTAEWSFAWSPITSDGLHTIRSRATDNAGNVESPGQSVTVVVDNSKPTSSISLPASGQVVTTPMLFIAGSSSDAVSGVKRVEITIRRGIDGFFWNGGSWIGGETWLETQGDVADWNYLLTTLPTVGMLTIVSRATDNMGNVEIPGPGVVVSIQRGYRVAIPIIISDFTP